MPGQLPLTLAVFACVPLMGVVSVYLNGRLRARFRQQRVQIGELNSTIEDSLLGQGVVKAFAAEDEERRKFAKGNRDFEQIKTLGYYAMGAFNTSTRLFDGLMYLVVILAGGLSLVYGRITAGDWWPICCTSPPSSPPSAASWSLPSSSSAA